MRRYLYAVSAIVLLPFIFCALTGHPRHSWAQEPAIERQGAPADVKPKGLDTAAIDEADGGSSTTSEAEGKRWAVLIGVNSYENNAHLSFCAKDMEMLGDTLIKHCGYDKERVTILTDVSRDAHNNGATEPGSTGVSRRPTKGSIITAIHMVCEQAGEHDAILFAFSGHGELDTNDSVTYIIPIDASTKNKQVLEDTAIPIQRIRDYLERSRAKQKVIILDCCHAAGKGAGRSAKGDNASHDNRFRSSPLPLGKGTVELLSCDADQMSWEDPMLGHGVFTYYLVKALEGSADLQPYGDSDGHISFDEAYKYILKEVQEQVRLQLRQTQTPVQRKGQVAGQLVLSSRRLGDEGGGMTVNEIKERISELGAKGKVGGDIKRDVEKWLSHDRTFPAIDEARLLSSLLARERITETEYRHLIQSRKRQLDLNQA